MIKKRKNKNSETGLKGVNGIYIDGDISFSSDKDINANYFRSIQFAITAFAALCTVFMGASFLDINIIANPVIFLTIMLTAAFAFIASKIKALRFIGGTYLIVHIIYLISVLSNIKDGFFYTVFRYFQKANQPDSFYSSKIKDISPYDYEYISTHFFVFLGSVIVIVLAAACIFRIDFPMMFIITFPVFELGMYWGWQPKTWTAIGLVVCWITVLALHIINHTTNKAGKTNTFALHDRKKSYFLTSSELKQRFFTVYSKSVALMCALIFIVLILFFSISGFVRPEAFNQMRKNISSAVNDFSFNEIKNFFEDYDGGLNLFNVKTVGGTNGGILGKTDSISFNGSTALKVKTIKPSYPLYLRGYVAGKYEDNRWNEIEFEKDDERLKAFNEKNIFVQDYNYYLNYQKNQGSENHFFGNNHDITISVLGASKRFVYAPYMAYYSSDGNFGDDKMVPSPESYVNLRSKKYSLIFTDLSAAGNSWSNISASLKNKVYSDKITRSYESFVREKYLDINDSDILNNVYNRILGSYLTSDPNDVQSIYQAVYDYFKDNFQYTLSPGATPEGEDFIEYFLSSQKEGFCSYYASAGVMLMRKFGVPARYVEGYIVLPSQFADSEDSIPTAVVTDKSAHAWCEVFISDIGWIPLEFTPGYSNDNPNMTDTEKNPSKPQTSSVTTTASNNSTGTTVSKTTQSEKKSTASAYTTKKTTAAPSVTGKNNYNKSETSSVGNSGRNIIKPLILYLLGLIIIIAAVVLRHRYAVLKIEHQINNSDNRTAIQDIYRLCLKYLSLISVTSDKNITDIQAADEILEQCHKKNITGIDKDFIRLAESACEAYLSCNEISDKEAEFARGFLKHLSNEVILARLTALGKFAAKWIYNLY